MGDQRKSKAQTNEPTNTKPNHKTQTRPNKTQAPRNREAKRPARSLARSVSSRLKEKSADRGRALGVCLWRTKPQQTEPQATQNKKPNPTKPKQGQAYSLSACGTTGRTHLGGNENGELPHRPIQRGGAVRQEYARASQDKKKKQTNQTNHQPNKPTSARRHRKLPPPPVGCRA